MAQKKTENLTQAELKKALGEPIEKDESLPADEVIPRGKPTDQVTSATVASPNDPRIQNISKSEFLEQFPAEKMWTLFVDGKKQYAGWKVFESREPGYMLGMYDAMLTELSDKYFNEPLSAESLLRIHDHATNGVQNTNYDTFGQHRGDFRGPGNYIGYGCRLGTNMSQAGFRELQAYSATYPDVFKLRVKETLKDDGTLAVRYYMAACISDNARGEVERVLENYHGELAASQNDEQKIRVVISMVSEIERIHPFSDANCRTLCMATLTKELLKQNIMPPILDDPNQFDGLSQDELYEKVIEGMKRTQELIQTGEIKTEFRVGVPIKGDQLAETSELTDLTDLDPAITFIQWPATDTPSEKANYDAAEKRDALVMNMIYFEAVSKVDPEQLFPDPAARENFQSRKEAYQKQIDDLAQRITMGMSVAQNQLVEAVRFGCDNEVKNLLSKVESISPSALLSALEEAKKSKRTEVVEPLTQKALDQLATYYENGQEQEAKAFLQAIYNANPNLALDLTVKLNGKLESQGQTVPTDLAYTARLIIAERVTAKAPTKAPPKSTWLSLTLFNAKSSQQPDKAHIESVRQKATECFLTSDDAGLQKINESVQRNIRLAEKKGDMNNTSNFYCNVNKILPQEMRTSLSTSASPKTEHKPPRNQ